MKIYILFRYSGFKGLSKVCSGTWKLIIVHTGHVSLRINLLVPGNHIIWNLSNMCPNKISNTPAKPHLFYLSFHKRCDTLLIMLSSSAVKFTFLEARNYQLSLRKRQSYLDLASCISRHERCELGFRRACVGEWSVQEEIMVCSYETRNG